MEAIVDVPQHGAQVERLTTCKVVLTVPKMAIASSTADSGKAWQRCLHSGYKNGWVVIGDNTSPAPRAIGKPQSFEHVDGITRVPLHFLLVQDFEDPSIWLRGTLDETVLNLDARASLPSTTTGRPCGWLGNWPIKFVVGNTSDWQYREMCQIIHLANRSLPDGEQINLANENCLDPHRLWMPEKSIVNFDIGGAV